jgi:hypothetical protein
MGRAGIFQQRVVGSQEQNRLMQFLKLCCGWNAHMAFDAYQNLSSDRTSSRKLRAARSMETPGARFCTTTLQRFMMCLPSSDRLKSRRMSADRRAISSGGI